MSNIRLHKEHGLNPTIPQCYWCGEDKNEVALLGAAYKGEAPMHMILDYVPCEKCQKMWSQGVVVIAVTTRAQAEGQMPLTPNQNVYPTGQWSVISRDAVGKIAPDSMAEQILKSGKCLMLETEYNMMFASPPEEELHEHREG